MATDYNFWAVGNSRNDDVQDKKLSARALTLWDNVPPVSFKTPEF